MEGLESETIHKSESNSSRLLNAFTPDKATNGKVTIGIGLGTRSRLVVYGNHKLDIGIDAIHGQYDRSLNGLEESGTYSIVSGAVQYENGILFGGEGYVYRSDGEASDFLGFKVGDDEGNTVTTNGYIDNGAANLVDPGVGELGFESDAGVIDFVNWFVNGITNYIKETLDRGAPQVDLSKDN